MCIKQQTNFIIFIVVTDKSGINLDYYCVIICNYNTNTVKNFINLIDIIFMKYTEHCKRSNTKKWHISERKLTPTH